MKVFNFTDVKEIRRTVTLVQLLYFTSLMCSKIEIFVEDATRSRRGFIRARGDEI